MWWAAHTQIIVIIKNHNNNDAAAAMVSAGKEQQKICGNSQHMRWHLNVCVPAINSRIDWQANAQALNKYAICNWAAAHRCREVRRGRGAWATLKSHQQIITNGMERGGAEPSRDVDADFWADPTYRRHSFLPADIYIYIIYIVYIVSGTYTYILESCSITHSPQPLSSSARRWSKQ